MHSFSVSLSPNPIATSVPSMCRYLPSHFSASNEGVTVIVNGYIAKFSRYAQLRWKCFLLCVLPFQKQHTTVSLVPKFQFLFVYSSLFRCRPFVRSTPSREMALKPQSYKGDYAQAHTVKWAIKVCLFEEV